MQDYYEKISSVPVYFENNIPPYMKLKVKYKTGIGYKTTIEGELIRHYENPSRQIFMILRCSYRDYNEDKVEDVSINVKRIVSMERLVKVDPDFDIGI